MSYGLLNKEQNYTNLLGEELSADEQALLQAYYELKWLAGRDLSPCALSNVRSALASLWQAVNGLNLEFEQLDEVSV